MVAVCSYTPGRKRRRRAHYAFEPDVTASVGGLSSRDLPFHVARVLVKRPLSEWSGDGKDSAAVPEAVISCPIPGCLTHTTLNALRLGKPPQFQP